MKETRIDDEKVAVADIWSKSNEMYEQGLKEEAVLYLLEEGDDIYLLRLLLKFQEDIFQSIRRDVMMQLIDRVILIMESDFLNRLSLEFIQDFAS